VDYWDISNEQVYCERKLTEIIGNKTLAEQIYRAHTNPNEPIVHLDIVVSIINWNKQSLGKIPVSRMWYNCWIDMIKMYVCQINSSNNNLNVFDDFDNESGSETENESTKTDLTHELFYKIIDDQVYLTQSGLHLYLRVELKFLSGIDEYVKISKFYENITQGLVDILREFRQKELNLSKHYFTGLEF
jgi:hypothetical protein